jgi:hypothetical protein
MSWWGMHATKLLALLPLACASAAAAPDRPPPPAPTAPAPSPPAGTRPDQCRPAGAVLFEIDHRAEPGAKLATWTTRVYASGAWTRDDRDADGKAAPQRVGGCLARPELKQLETTLANAPWKVTTATIRCMAISSEFTVYLVQGKQVFTRRLCSGESLDDKSRAKLDAAIAQVEGGAGKPTP